MPQGGHGGAGGDPLEVLGYQYDLACNGYELVSGAIRNHKPEIMFKAFEIAGYGEDEVASASAAWSARSATARRPMAAARRGSTGS
jgi:aspartyl-tRNA synthetase